MQAVGCLLHVFNPSPFSLLYIHQENGLISKVFFGRSTPATRVAKRSTLYYSWP